MTDIADSFVSEQARRPVSPPQEVVYACQTLEGHILEGNKKSEWQVIQRLELSSDPSRGNFSVGYIVQDEKGHKAFAKVFDARFVLRLEDDEFDATQSLQEALHIFSFEREVLELCRGNNLDRVVTIIDGGHFFMPYKGAQEMVFFIIFELAKAS